MNDEIKTECMELCVTACEKFSQNNEVRSFIFLLFNIFHERYFRVQRK